MDVRCERCKTQYVFDDDQVGEAGLTVRCSNCGHVFKVKRKALVVTVPVKPGELGETPIATADIHRGAAASVPAASARGGAERVPDWTLRKPNGDVYPFRDLSTLQKWVVERKASREDEVSRQGEPWRRLSELPELEPFFAVIERADRGPMTAPASVPAQGAATVPKVPQPTMIEFPQPRPVFPGPGHQPAPARTEPGFGPGAGGEGPMLAGELPPVPPESWEAPAARRQSAPEPAWTADPDERPSRPEEDAGDGGERRAVKRSHFAPIAVVLGLFVATGLVVFLANPAWFGLEGAKPHPQVAAAPAPAQIPVTTEVPAKPPEPPPASATVAPAPSPAAPAATSGSTASSSPNSTSPQAAAPQPAPPPAAATPAPAATPTEQPKVAAAKPAPPPEKPAEPRKPRGLKGLLADAQRLRDRGKATEALDVYGRALELEPENADALAGRGLCYLELSQYAPAEASFQAALDSAAQHADALMGLAETYRYEGRRAEAVTYYQKYLAAHPEGEDAVAARNAIQALKE